jgi:hypothetical protein
MAKTEAELIDEAIDRGLDDAQIKELLVRSRAKTAPAASVAKPPAAPSPRPAPAAAAKPAPLTAVAAPRVTAPPPAEPAMEAMVSSVKPIAAPAQTPTKPSPQPTMSSTQLAAEEQIQLERMLAEQDAIREAQNVGYVREAMMPLAALAAPAVLATGPLSAPLAGVAALAPGAAAAFPQAVAGGLSKLGFYGKTEATPAMREEARRRALAQADAQRYVASEQNTGSKLVEGVMDVPSSMYAPFAELGKGLGSAARTVENVLEKGKRPGTVAQAGKLFLGEKKTPEEFALGKGGAFAENARRVKAAPEKFVPVGPRDTETDRLTGMEYAQIVSPKIAAVEYRNEFDAWAKRFPKEAQSVRAEVAKEGAARQATAKAAAPLLKVADYIEQNAGALPVGEDVGMSDEELSATLGVLGVSQAENIAGGVSGERAANLIARLRTPR